MDPETLLLRMLAQSGVVPLRQKGGAALVHTHRNIADVIRVSFVTTNALFSAVFDGHGLGHQFLAACKREVDPPKPSFYELIHVQGAENRGFSV